MKVDYNIRKALQGYIDDKGMNNKELAQMLGISPVAVGKWFNRERSGINDAIWDTKVLPLIKDRLPLDRFYTDDDGKVKYKSEVAQTTYRQIDSITRSIPVPLFSGEQLAEYNGNDIILEFAQRNGVTKQIDFIQRYAKAVDAYALSMPEGAMPNIPTSATFFVCAGRKPMSGRLHIFKRADGVMPQVGIYNFDQKAFQIDIWGVTWGDKTLAGKTSDFKRMVAWIHPVVYYIIDCK